MNDQQSVDSRIIARCWECDHIDVFTEAEWFNPANTGCSACGYDHALEWERVFLANITNELTDLNNGVFVKLIDARDDDEDQPMDLRDKLILSNGD